MGSFNYSITLVLWTLLYLIPGMVLAEITLSPVFSVPKRVVIGAAVSITAYILIGYVLSRLSLLSHQAAMASVLIIDAISVAAYILWRHRQGRESRGFLARLTRRDMLITLALILIIALSMLVFFAWENQAPGIGAWDRSDHLPRMLYLDQHHHLPLHELGTEVTPYYPRGLHMAGLFFTAPFFQTKPVIELSSPFLAFIAICIGLLPLALYALSLSFFKDRKTALFSSVLFLVFSFTFIFSSFACTLGMLLAIVAIMLEIEFIAGGCSSKHLLLFALFACAVFLIHLVVFLILLAFSLAVLTGALISRRKSGFRGKTAWKFVGVMALAIILPLLFLAATSPALLEGTITYMGIRESGEAKVSNVTPGKMVKNAFSFRSEELLGLVYHCLVILPFIFLGALGLFRKQKWVPLCILLVALYLSISRLVWFNNRVNFYMLIPFTLIGGYGLSMFMASKQRRARTLISYTLILLLLVVGALGSASLHAARGTYLQGIGFWDKDFRLQTYVTQDAYELARWIEDNGLEGVRFASNNQGAYYLLVEALTDTRILMASRFSGVQSFSDMLELFDPETPKAGRLEIIEEYRLGGLITNNARKARELLRDELGFRLVRSVPGYYVLLLPDVLPHD